MSRQCWQSRQRDLFNGILLLQIESSSPSSYSEATAPFDLPDLEWPRLSHYRGLAASHSSKDPPSLGYWLFAYPQLNSVRWCCRGRAKREKRPFKRYFTLANRTKNEPTAPGESSSETESPYSRMPVTKQLRATIPVQNGARLSWDRWIASGVLHRQLQSKTYYWKWEELAWVRHSSTWEEYLDKFKCLEAKCREKPWKNPGSNRSRWRFGWVDKAQCLRSARRFGAVGSSPDFSRVFHDIWLLGI